MATFHKGGGGYGKNAFATLHLVDESRLLMELWMKRIECEVPDCNEQAIAIINVGTAPLVCMAHRDAFLSNNKVSRALNTSIRKWLQFHITDMARQAYEGQDDPDMVILVVDDLNRAENLLDQAMNLAKAATSLVDMQAKIKNAATNAVPVQVIAPEVTPKVRPSITSLPKSNVHNGLQLFPSQG